MNFDWLALHYDAFLTPDSSWPRRYGFGLCDFKACPIFVTVWPAGYSDQQGYKIPDRFLLSFWQDWQSWIFGTWFFLLLRCGGWFWLGLLFWPLAYMLAWGNVEWLAVAAASFASSIGLTFSLYMVASPDCFCTLAPPWLQYGWRTTQFFWACMVGFESVLVLYG